MYDIDIYVVGEPRVKKYFDILPNIKMGSTYFLRGVLIYHTKITRRVPFVKKSCRAITPSRNDIMSMGPSCCPKIRVIAIEFLAFVNNFQSLCNFCYSFHLSFQNGQIE